MVKSFNESYENGELGESQKQAVTTLIDKGKGGTLLKKKKKNWRPISLWKVDYNIASKAVSRRFISYLPTLIHENQVGCVQGHSILDNIRNIADVIDHSKNMILPGISINIDFEKAFDSLNWNFLIAALEKFYFDPSLIKWIDEFYTNVSSSILNNGFTSKHFKVKTGVRQGDPLLPYLFTMVVEVMACKIRQEDKMKGIHTEDETIKVLQYADDTNGILQDTS